MDGHISRAQLYGTGDFGCCTLFLRPHDYVVSKWGSQTSLIQVSKQKQQAQQLGITVKPADQTGRPPRAITC